jgi:predicted dehydrogenase
MILSMAALGLPFEIPGIADPSQTVFDFDMITRPLENTVLPRHVDGKTQQQWKSGRNDMSDATYSRRELLKHSGMIGAGLAFAGLSSATAGQSAANPVRIGFVGVGARGSCLLKILLELKDVEIRALCDLREDRVVRAQRWVVDAGQAEPQGYWRGETDFKRLCQQNDLDLVITATPWRWHVPVCVAAMEAGRHAATEVPAAVTLDECWQLVETSERTGRHCVMLEQYCYFRKAMTILNMIRRGVFGELLHLEGRTQEDWIRENWHLFNSDGTIDWYAEYATKRNGNLYPTHGFGPMAIWANINRGDRLDHLVSMSSKGRALQLHAEKSFSKDHALARQTYTQGDANITLLRSVNGVTFTLYFAGHSPQPWSPEHKVQGTLGSCIGDMFDYRRDVTDWIQAKVYERDKNANGRWGDYWDCLAEYDHPLWKALGAEANKRRAMDWSGAYDYLLLGQLTRAIRNRTAPPMDVYDAATWSALSELSERSVAGGSSVQEIPDFTKGKWKTNAPTDLSQV